MLIIWGFNDLMNKKTVSIFLIILMLIVIPSTAINISKESHDQNLILIRIYTKNNQHPLPNDFEIVGISQGKWIDIITTEDKLQELSNLGLEYEVIIWNVVEYDNSVRGSYHTLSEMETMLQDIADDHPDITKLYNIGTTYEGRDIWCLEISDNPGVDESEPGVLFMGVHHAREWPALEICLNICEELTSGYESLVNNLRIWVVPCVNPDGYYYCHDQGHDWRKNRQPYTGGIGVDLNRNYAGSSDGDPWGSWGSVQDGAATHDAGQEVYCGPDSFSEVETQAIRDVFLQNNITASISWHTYGELVMWPWGYTPTYAPDQSYLKEVGQQIASKISKQSGSGTYTPQQACTLYPTTGDTDDWAYGYSNYILGRPTFSYTIESCSDFHPSEGYLDQIISENFDGALYLLEEAQNIKDTVTPRVIPPVIDEMGQDIDGNYTVTWQEQNPAANPSKFQLDELIGPNFYIDDAESESDFWTISGFTISTARSHSSGHSYKSGAGDDQVFSMVTNDPIPINLGMQLDFWCCYNLENNYDMTFVEVSTNGRSYDVIDAFTGSSGDWIHKQYSLDSYSGKSIFIRFRYVTDSNTQNEGFYIDDISPVVGWDSITTLSDSITDNYYEVSDKDNGVYYYRVKGYNSEHEWCDFSILENVEVEIFANDPPVTPTIIGSTSGKPDQEYEYKIKSTDPNGDQVYYCIEWGDGDKVEWNGPYNTNQEITISHTWDKQGTYIIKARAKDVWNYESQWGTLTVTMPRDRITNNFIFEKLIDIFKNLQYFMSRFRGI
jgi:hypothetical protein